MRASVHHLTAVSVAETLGLGRGIVDLWYYFYEGVNDSDLLAAHEVLMTPDERERHGRFHFERDRRLFLATRALVRTVLSSYAAVAPAAWRFDVGEHGKPRVAHPAVKPVIHFNVSNTPGLVVCAVSVVHEALGVDAEALDRWTATAGGRPAATPSDPPARRDDLHIPGVRHDGEGEPDVSGAGSMGSIDRRGIASHEHRR